MKVNVTYKCQKCKQFFKVIRHLPDMIPKAKSPLVEICILKNCSGKADYQYHDVLET